MFLWGGHALREERLAALWRNLWLLVMGPLLQGVAPAPHEKLSFSTSCWACFHALRVDRFAVGRNLRLLVMGPLLRGVAPAPHEKLSFSTSC